MIRGVFELHSGFVLELIPDDPSVNVHLFLFCSYCLGGDNAEERMGRREAKVSGHATY